MFNIKLILEYDGSNYCGWQIQETRDKRQGTRKKSIQETIEKALCQILQEKVRLTASGRTDAGVHAIGQVANFKTEKKIELAKLQKGVNALLPRDIVVTSIKKATAEFHSRYSAKSKIYRYLILNSAYASALLREKVYHCSYPLNIALMRREARVLLGKHDFRVFCASGSAVKSTIRTIKRITVLKKPCFLFSVSLICIEIEADGFLYNMVRNIAGTLIEIGRGRLPPASMKKILKFQDKKLAGPTINPCGLYLVKVKYTLD